MKNVISTDLRTFLIKFHGKGTQGKFICQDTGLVETIKNYDAHGIEYIKEFDPAKNTFKRVQKDSVLNYFSWNTEAFLFLQNHSYFKK